MTTGAGPLEGGEEHLSEERSSARVALDLGRRGISMIVGAQTFVVPIADVQEVLTARPISRVFRAPPTLAGVTSLRGEILPVIRLAALLGLEPARGLDGGRIVVVRETSGERRRAGLEVEALGPARPLEASGAERGLLPVPLTVPKAARPFLVGMLDGAPRAAVLSVREILDACTLSRDAPVREGA
jgi:chemotaxis signal transduction protein